MYGNMSPSQHGHMNGQGQGPPGMSPSYNSPVPGQGSKQGAKPGKVSKELRKMTRKMVIWLRLFIHTAPSIVRVDMSLPRKRHTTHPPLTNASLHLLQLPPPLQHGQFGAVTLHLTGVTIPTVSPHK